MTGTRTFRLAENARRPLFPRSARLLKPAEFTAVFRDAEASTDAFFRVLWRAGTGPVSRLGLAVSRKVDRRAAGRNRIKRVVRESFRHWCAAVADPPRDVVVLPRPPAAQADNAVLRRSLERHWQRIGRAAERSPTATKKVN